MTQEELDKLNDQARIAQEREQANRTIAAEQPMWRIKEQQSLKDYYGRMQAAHERAMEARRARMAASPGSFSPQAKEAVDDYFAKKAEEEQRLSNNEFRNEELETRENIARYERDGRIEAGSGAATIKAEVDKYISDNTLKGIETQAQKQAEMEREKREFEKWRTDEGFRLEDEKSKREHGFWDADGVYHPGSRERTGQITADGRIDMEEKRQKGRERIQGMKNDGSAEKEKINGLFKIIGKILGKKRGEGMQDAIDAAKKLGISEKELKEAIEGMDTNPDEGAARKEEQKMTSTARTAAMTINRFA